MPLSNYLFYHHNILPFWLIYSVLCLPLVYLMLILVPFRLRHRPLLPFIFFYALSVSIVIFGIVISFVLIMILHFQKPIRKAQQFLATVDYPDYQRPPQSEMSEFGEGSGFKIVTTENLSKSLRQSMLVAINQFGMTSVNKINYLALSDDIDEISLYAQGLIERQERRLSNLVKSFSQQLEKTKDKKIAAFYKKQIAEVLWEQVYKYLIINENLVVTLNKITRYAREALQNLPDDMELPLLLAKVALRGSNLDEAKEWLKIATINQAPDYKIISNLAEIEYAAGNYSKIRGILSNCQTKGIIGLQPVISFWVTYD